MTKEEMNFDMPGDDNPNSGPFWLNPDLHSWYSDHQSVLVSSSPHRISEKEKDPRMRDVFGLSYLIKQAGGRFKNFKLYLERAYKWAWLTAEFEEKVKKRVPENRDGYINFLVRLSLLGELERIKRLTDNGIGIEGRVIQGFKPGEHLETVVYREHGTDVPQMSLEEKADLRPARYYLLDQGKVRNPEDILKRFEREYGAICISEKAVEDLLVHASRVIDYKRKKGADKSKTFNQLTASELIRTFLKLNYELSIMKRSFDGKDLVIDYITNKDRRTGRPRFEWIVFPMGANPRDPGKNGGDKPRRDDDDDDDSGPKGPGYRGNDPHNPDGDGFLPFIDL